MRVSNDTLITGDTESIAVDWTSEAISLQYLNYYSIQLEFDGFISGSFFLEYSNTEDLKKAVWSFVDGSNQVITEAGDHTWEVREAAYRWVRVRWDHNMGTGVLTSARFNAKGL